MTATLAVVAEAYFDGDRHFCAGPYTVVVDNGFVTDIVQGDFSGALAGRGAEVVAGGYLMPGLVDAHCHLFLDGSLLGAAARARHLNLPPAVLLQTARDNARKALARGVTLVRDAGDRHGINNRIRDEAKDAAGGLPHVRSGGLGVKRAKRYGAFMATDVLDADSIRRSVTELAAANDEIKVMLTGIIDFDAGAVTDEPQFTLDEARLLVETARACGRNTFAHCSGAQGLAIAAQAGVGSIEHGFFMNRETLAVMADKGIAWTPTFCPVHFHWAHPEPVGWSARTVGNLRRILDEHARHLQLAHEMGVTLLLGTDAGSLGVEHGHAVFGEIDRYLEAGLPLEATLKAATSNARRHFDFRHATLTRGAPFDAVLLAGSPFDDVTALREPLKVWPARWPEAGKF